MAVIYDLKPIPGQDPDLENPLLHPYIVSSGTMPCRKILEEICRASTFTVPDLEGALLALSERVLDYLNDGYRVELGHFGYFSVTLKAAGPIRDRKEIRADAIRPDRVNFRPKASFRKKLNCKLQRARPGQGQRSSSNLSDEECLERLYTYLQEYTFITRLDYSVLTGKLRNTASRQLKRFVEAGVIVTRGQGNRVVYRLPPRK